MLSVRAVNRFSTTSTLAPLALNNSEIRRFALRSSETPTCSTRYTVEPACKQRLAGRVEPRPRIHHHVIEVLTGNMQQPVQRFLGDLHRRVLVRRRQHRQPRAVLHQQRRQIVRVQPVGVRSAHSPSNTGQSDPDPAPHRQAEDSGRSAPCCGPIPAPATPQNCVGHRGHSRAALGPGKYQQLARLPSSPGCAAGRRTDARTIASAIELVVTGWVRNSRAPARMQRTSISGYTCSEYTITVTALLLQMLSTRSRACSGLLSSSTMMTS